MIQGVQWSDTTEKQNDSGRISVAKYATVTFPAGTYEGITLAAGNEDDCIIYGECDEEITGKRGQRVSDILERHPKSGRIKSVNDNSNRAHLKNIKVVVA